MLTSCRSRGTTERTMAMTLRHGYDMSNHQGELTVSQCDGDFYIFKATEGVNFTDGTFARHVAEVKAAGKQFGAYHFMRRGAVDVQAKHFVNVCNSNGVVGNGILCIDVEEPLIQSYDVQAMTEKVHELTGVWPLVYMNADFLNRGYLNATVARNCGLWLAGYPNGATMSNHTMPPTWKQLVKAHNATLCMWQWSGTQHVDGVTIDADDCYLTEAQWAAYAKSDAAQQAASEPTGNKWLVARDVINGKYGDGQTRRNNLGTRYNEIQACVNALINETDAQLANRVIKGEFGTNPTRAQILGNRYNNVQAIVNKRMK